MILDISYFSRHCLNTLKLNTHWIHPGLSLNTHKDTMLLHENQHYRKSFVKWRNVKITIVNTSEVN